MRKSIPESSQMQFIAFFWNENVIFYLKKLDKSGSFSSTGSVSNVEKGRLMEKELN